MADKVQQYTLGDRIGTGGTGIVRRARNTEDKTEAAIKTLQTDIARDPATRKRLLGSRKQLQSVSPHENVARVLDVLEQGDTLHVLMEYAPGKSLETSLGRKSRPMNPTDAVGILNQVLRGAVSAHSKGVLHGNLKPSDIILSNVGTEPLAKVSGFGIAKNLNNSTILRAAGRTQTLPYLAPEQVRGEAGDERTDVYSVGIMLYRMITGLLPYASSDRGAEARIRHAILNEPLPDIAETMPDLNVSPHILSVIRRATAKDRRERIPTMREFSRLLQKVQTELPAKEAASTTAAAVGAAAGALASGAASTLAAQASPQAPAALQFPPPPSTPIEQEVAFMQPVRSLSTPASLPESPTTPKAQETTPSDAPVSAQQTPASAPSQDESKEKSFWNILTNPGNITTPAAAGEPTLVKSEAQLEVERRMQALRASQAQAASVAAMQAASAQTAHTQESQPFAPDPQASSNLAPQTFSSAPQTPQYEAAKPSVSSSPASPYQAPKSQEDKKKRSLVPWLVVGAIALGGGIYYVALKNKGTSGIGTGTGSETSSQQALSKEEIERQYDSLQAGKPNDKAPASETPTTSEQQPATTVAEQPIAQEQSGQEQSSQQAQPSAQAQSSTEETKPATTVAEKPSTTSTPAKTAAPSNEAASNVSPKNSKANGSAAPATSPSSSTPKKSLTTSVKEGVNDDASAIAAKLRANGTKAAPSDRTLSENSSEKRAKSASSNSVSPKATSSKAAPQSTSENTSEGKARPKALANTNTPSQRTSETAAEKPSKQSRKTASSETPFSTSSDAASRTMPKETSSKENSVKETSTKDGSSKEKSNAKSGSLASYNAAQDGEREAARAKIRDKYSSHLSKKQSSGTGGKTSANSLAANSPANTTPASTTDGKSVPAALKNSNKTSPKTNREDNYTPPTNPVDATSETDASAVALEAASRKASSAEPYLILRGHVAGVRSVSFSPDGKLLASGGDDKTVKIWDAATGTILRSLRGHGNSVTSVFFSPDSKFVISSGKDKTVRIWDVETGNAIQRSPGVSCEGSPAAFSPDGSFIATANNRNINISKVQK